MVVNTEWGAFGEKGELDFIRTKWDYNVDKFSVNPSQHIFEKMISGMYMGELIRQVLVDLMKDDLIFFNCNRECLFERGTLEFLTQVQGQIRWIFTSKFSFLPILCKKMRFDCSGLDF